MKKFGKILINPSAFAKPGDVVRLKCAIDSYSPDKAAEMASKFAADGSWQVPTMVRLRTQEYADRPEYEQDEMLDYLQLPAIKRWREVTDRYKALPSEISATPIRNSSR